MAVIQPDIDRQSFSAKIAKRLAVSSSRDSEVFMQGQYRTLRYAVNG